MDREKGKGSREKAGGRMEKRNRDLRTKMLCACGPGGFNMAVTRR